MRATRALPLFAGAWLVWAGQANAFGAAQTGTPPQHAKVDELFASMSGTAPGCAVSISRNGVGDYARGYGIANLEAGAAITPQTVFAVASISKQFAAFSIGLLAQEGKLSLGDDVRKHVPELPDLGERITVSQLIHHTSGLRDQGHLVILAGWRASDVSTEDDMLWAIQRQQGLNHSPGEEVVYGNSAYTLLAVIVRRVSGQSLKDFAQTRIFAPLGMSDTRFSDDVNEIIPRRAIGYSPRQGGGWTTNVPRIEHYGSNGLFTTVGDLAKWQRNFLDHQIGGPALGAWMQSSGLLNSGVAIGYGGGLRLGAYRGLRTVGHDGVDGGYRAESVLFPDQGFGAIVLCNASNIAPVDLARRVADIYLGEQMRGTALEPMVNVEAGEQARWAGTYWSAQTDEVVQIEWKDDVLRPIGGSALTPIGQGVFRPSDQPHEWRFRQPTGEAAAQLHIRDTWPTYRVFSRIDPAPPPPETFKDYGGSYRSEETAMTYVVRLADGALRVSWPRGWDLMLTPIGGDRFVSSRGTITFTRASTGQITGLTISNRRLRRLTATRLESGEAASRL